GSSFDPNTGVYTPPRALGNFDPQTGNYVPLKGVELDPVKGFVAEASPAAPAPGAAPQPGTPAPATPPPQVLAMVQALNQSIRLESAGRQVSFDKTFTPTA